MMRYEDLLLAAKKMIEDFPADWAKFCEDTGIVHPTIEDEIDFYFAMTHEDDK